jgi:CRP/FNR family transcriptional regulator, cyclic AMP receptor protein
MSVASLPTVRVHGVSAGRDLSSALNESNDTNPDLRSAYRPISSVGLHRRGCWEGYLFNCAHIPALFVYLEAHATINASKGAARLPIKTSRRSKSNGNIVFNAQNFLDSAGVARKVTEFAKKHAIFSQGDPAKNVLYIQKGAVRLSVVNETGKEAVVAVLGPGDFFGEGCLAGQPLRIGSAIAVTATTVLVIEKKEMIRVLHVEHEFSDRFISYMLSRNIRIEEDLVDQLFNSSEKRLARTLLLLARYGKEDKPQRVLPKVSQEMLAEMVGTTRSRVNFFMNKFRKMGFIKYNGGLQINTSLLSVVLHD